MSHRVFIALPLAEVFEKELSGILDQAVRWIPQGVKWTPLEQLHLTFHFFPALSDERLELLKKITRSVTASFPCLKLGLKGVGGFPDFLKPRVIWLGLEGDTGVLEKYQTQLGEKLTLAEFFIENRPFHPHVTLGRVKDFFKAQKFLGEGKNLSHVEVKGQTLNYVVLMESRLSAEGPRYEILEKFSLSA